MPLSPQCCCDIHLRVSHSEKQLIVHLQQEEVQWRQLHSPLFLCSLVVSIAVSHLVWVESLPFTRLIDTLAWPDQTRPIFFVVLFFFTDVMRYASATQPVLEYCVFHLSVNQSSQGSMNSWHYGNWKERKWLWITAHLLIVFEYPTPACRRVSDSAVKIIRGPAQAPHREELVLASFSHLLSQLLSMASGNGVQEEKLAVIYPWFLKLYLVRFSSLANLKCILFHNNVTIYQY